MQTPADTLLTDTAAEAEAVWLAMWRAAPAWRKLALVGELNAGVRALAVAGIRARHPQADAAEVQRRLADLVLGPALAARVYPREHSADGE